MDSLRLFLRLARPHFLIGAALLYALGVGIARYLGTQVDWEAYLLGQAWVSLLQLSTHFLNEYYDAPADTANPNRTPFSGGSGAVGPGKLTRSTALISAAACLTVVASLTVLLISRGYLSPAAQLIMFLAFLGSFFYSAPPVRLASSGYGELVTSILVANLVPAFAFLLQTGELHRLVAMATFPLTALHLAMMMSFELPDYASDIKYDKQTLMVRMNWQNGMQLHNLLILIAFFLLGLAAVFGLPPLIALPGFLTLPLGLFQIWQMRRLAEGAKPNWTALTLNASMLFGITAYLLMFAFWTR
jgi:1,4-dihydroxy-2-naphthoate octaprenyltransferase